MLVKVTMVNYMDCIVNLNSVPTRVLHFGVTRESDGSAGGGGSDGHNGWKAIDPIIVLFISGFTPKLKIKIITELGHFPPAR